MIATRLFPSLLLAALCGAPMLAQSNADTARDLAQERETSHQSVDWLAVAPHLPDLDTGSATALETAGDVLRARRFPDDALDYYLAALHRGGNRGRLMNRIGVTQLELHKPAAARTSFQLAVAANPNDGEGWNNLGAAEYVLNSFPAAVFDYRKAVKLNKKAAVFHSNLGTAYFEQKDYEGARIQFTQAVKLDPAIFQHGGWGGVTAHVMTPQDRGRFCFEMAALAARTHDETSVLLWLTRAAEAGEDLKSEMAEVKELQAYRKDMRVALIVRNARAMRGGSLAVAGKAPPLPADGTVLN